MRRRPHSCTGECETWARPMGSASSGRGIAVRVVIFVIGWTSLLATRKRSRAWSGWIGGLTTSRDAAPSRADKLLLSTVRREFTRPAPADQGAEAFRILASRGAGDRPRTTPWPAPGRSRVPAAETGATHRVGGASPSRDPRSRGSVPSAASGGRAAGTPAPLRRAGSRSCVRRPSSAVVRRAGTRRDAGPRRSRSSGRCRYARPLLRRGLRLPTLAEVTSPPPRRPPRTPPSAPRTPARCAPAGSGAGARRSRTQRRLAPRWSRPWRRGRRSSRGARRPP